MDIQHPHELVLAETILASASDHETDETPLGDPNANPFKLVVDPTLRFNLRKALMDLIVNHEEWLAQSVAENKLSIDSYKEYVELFARSLKETMETREGIAYLLRCHGSPQNQPLAVTKTSHPGWV